MILNIGGTIKIKKIIKYIICSIFFVYSLFQLLGWSKKIDQLLGWSKKIDNDNDARGPLFESFRFRWSVSGQNFSSILSMLPHIFLILLTFIYPYFLIHIYYLNQRRRLCNVEVAWT